MTTRGLRIQTGFWDLVRIDRVDLTVEQSVLDPEWAELFDPYPEHQAEARRRLEQVGVRVSGSPSAAGLYLASTHPPPPD